MYLFCGVENKYNDILRKYHQWKDETFTQQTRHRIEHAFGGLSH